MEIQMFNFAYLFWLIISIGCYVGLYFLLKIFSTKTQKIVLFSLLVFAFALNFLKGLFPPFSNNPDRYLEEIWPINICTANILLFPFLYLSKNKYVKDYMFYIGILSSLIAILYPVEALEKANQSAEYLDIIRFYIHHITIGLVPTLSILLGHHKLSYRRVFAAPIGLLLLMLFIMICQIIQTELGFAPLRNDDFLNINISNTSFIWGPKDYEMAKVLTAVCPKIFKTVPFGEFAGQEKYWPWVWMIVPVFLYVTPLAFAISMIFDHKAFKEDVVKLFNFIRNKFNKSKTDENTDNES